MLPIILSQKEFIDIYPKLKNKKDLFFISIIDPEDKPLFRARKNYKTWKFFDIEHDINNYKAITWEQAKEIGEFINKNLDKRLVVHCHAGIARSSAIGEFYYELLGGSYKELTEHYKNIMPNGRVLYYLRATEKEKTQTVKANFI